MVSVKKTASKPATKKANKSAEKPKTQEKTAPKSADVKSTNASERAKDIKRNEEIKDGNFKSRSDATVGDIAQAAVMKEDGSVDPKEVQSKITEMVSTNPELKSAAEKAGINLDNPTEEDLQKLANLDVKAGQEVKVGETKENGEVKAPEEAGEEEKPEGAGGGGGGEEPQEAGGPQGAGGPCDKQGGNDPLAEIMDLINKAEQATDPAEKSKLAGEAIQKINAIRSEKGVKKGEGQQQQQNQTGKNDKSQQLVNTINSGGKVDSKQLSSVLQSGDKAQLANVLDALESRAIKAKNGNNTTQNAMTLDANMKAALQKIGMPNLLNFANNQTQLGVG